MEGLLPVLFILAAGVIDLIQRWQRRAKRPPLEQPDPTSSPEVVFDLEEILRGTARPRKPEPPPARPTPKAPAARRAPLPSPAPEGPRGARPVVQPVARAPHPVLTTLKRPADVRQAIVVSTILGRCPGME